MQLATLIQPLQPLATQGSMSVAIECITFDSRQVQPNTLYVAQKGTTTDGHLYIDAAIANGAIAIVVEYMPAHIIDDISYIVVKSTTVALGILADVFYQSPSKNLTVIGITGTNGKTTVATLLYQLAIKLGYKAALLSTIENKINNETYTATHTTPDAISLQRYFLEMIKNDCQFCFMEVSSHALDQGRVVGVHFSGAGFTNITHDHLDYHGTFDAYINAKKKLFDGLSKTAFAVSNKDDKRGAVMLQNCKANKIMYAIHTTADHTACIIENTFEGLMLRVDAIEMHSALVGEFNAYNLLLVYAIAIELGWEQLSVLTAMSALQPAKGRFQFVKSTDNILAVVDYAHTPDALQKIIITLNQIRTKNEKLITVLGCGGDRDKLKRPEMGRIAALGADKVVLTSDNPRTEDPHTILEEINGGIDLGLRRKVTIIEDRKQAIHAACSMASAGDIILIAGKGHETYQEVRGIKHPFDDFKIVTERLN